MANNIYFTKIKVLLFFFPIKKYVLRINGVCVSDRKAITKIDSLCYWSATSSQILLSVEVIEGNFVPDKSCLHFVPQYHVTTKRESNMYEQSALGTGYMTNSAGRARDVMRSLRRCRLRNDNSKIKFPRLHKPVVLNTSPRGIDAANHIRCNPWWPSSEVQGQRVEWDGDCVAPTSEARLDIPGLALPDTELSVAFGKLLLNFFPPSGT